MVALGDLTKAVEDGDRNQAVDLTRQAIAEGIDPRDTLAAMTSAMDTVGGRF